MSVIEEMIGGTHVLFVLAVHMYVPPSAGHCGLHSLRIIDLALVVMSKLTVLQCGRRSIAQVTPLIGQTDVEQ